MLQACLNGARPAATPALPVTPGQVAHDALACRAAGAECLHIHPRDPEGRESLAPADVADHLAAVRRAVPGMPVGISTGDWIKPRDSRLGDMRDWHERPDYVSVNLSEADAPEVIALMAQMGIGVELGLESLADLDRLAALGEAGAAGAVRAMIEMPGGPLDDMMPVARRMLERLRREWPGIAVLLHGTDANAWGFVAAARDLGCDTRIGLEDCLLSPDGLPAGNAELVATARAMLVARG